MRKIYLLIVIEFLFVTAYSQDWFPLGEGTGTDNKITAMSEYQGKLIVGGTFNKAGGEAAYHVAQWDGSNWAAMGNGFDGEVRALAVYNGELYAGGIFSSDALFTQAFPGMAKWDGNAWAAIPVPDPLTYDIRALFVLNGKLYTTKHTSYNTFKVEISSFNGTDWTDLPGEFTGPENYRYIYALGEYQGNLVAAGIFDVVGGVEAQRIAMFNGISWESLDFPVLGESGGILDGRVNTLAEFEGKLWAGGLFTNFQGLTYGVSIASFDGDTWVPFAFDENTGNEINDFEILDNTLIASGSFGFYQGEDIVTGCVAYNNLAENPWQNLNFYNAASSNSEGKSMAVVNGELYLGGKFEYAGSGTTKVNNIVRFNGMLPTGFLENTPNPNSLTIFPNPAYEHVSFDISLFKNTASILYKIIDENGRTVFSGTTIENFIPISFLTPGIYHLILNSSENIYTANFIKL